MKYRRKPMEVDAAQWHSGREPQEGVAALAVAFDDSMEAMQRRNRGETCDRCSFFFVAHGYLVGQFVCPGDWIVRDAKNGLRICKPDAFAATYEPA